MSGALVGTQTAADRFTVAVTPDRGIPVTLHVVPQIAPKGRRYAVVRDPDGGGYITRHTTFEAAVKGAHHRAKRYLASYARTHKRKAA